MESIKLGKCKLSLDELNKIFSLCEPEQFADAISDLIGKSYAMLALYTEIKNDWKQEAVINDIIMPATESIYFLNRLQDFFRFAEVEQTS